MQVAKAEQVLAVRKAQNAQNKSILQFEREILLAKNDAIVREIKAKAQAYTIEQGAIAEAYKIKQLKGAQLQQFTDLTAAINMSQAELLQYVYMNVLKDSKQSEMYLDYKKVPLFLEDSN